MPVKIVDFDAGSDWSQSSSLVKLEKDNAAIVANIKTNYASIDVEQTMQDLIRCEQMLHLAYVAAGKHESSVPVLDIMARYQDVVHASSSLSNKFVGACLNALENHEFALACFREKDVEGGAAMFGGFKEVAEQMAKDAGEMADRVGHLADLSRQAATKAQEGVVENTKEKAKAEEEMHKLKADQEKWQSKSEALNAEKQKLDDKAAQQKQLAETKKQEAKEARGRRQAQLTALCNGIRNQRKTALENYVTKKAEIASRFSKSFSAEEKEIAEAQQNLLDQQTALKSLSIDPGDQDADLEFEKEVAEEAKEGSPDPAPGENLDPAAAKEESPGAAADGGMEEGPDPANGLIQTLWDSTLGKVFGSFSGGAAKPSEGLRGESALQTDAVQKSAHAELSAAQIRRRDALRQKKRREHDQKKIQQTAEVEKADAALKRLTAKMQGDKTEQQTKYAEELKELKAQQDTLMQAEELSIQKFEAERRTADAADKEESDLLLKEAQEAIAAAKAEEDRARDMVQQSIDATAQYKKCVSLVKDVKDGVDDLAKTIIFLGVVTLMMGRIKTAFNNVQTFWKEVANQSIKAVAAAQRVTNLQKSALVAIEKAIDSSATTWACLGIVNLQAFTAIQQAKEGIDKSMCNLSPVEDKAKTADMINRMMASLQIKEDEVQKTLKAIADQKADQQADPVAKSEGAS